MDVAPSDPAQRGGVNPSAAVTYDGQIHDLFQQRCAFCHNEHSSIPNWLDYSVVSAHLQSIYQKVVVDESMPMAPYDKAMTPDERKLVGDWINAGAPKSANSPSSSPSTTPSGGASPPPAPPAPDASLTFTKDIRPIFDSRCTTCHSSGSSLPVWTDYATAYDKRDLIYQRVYVTKDMPQGNATGMTDDERTLVAQWVQAGAPEGDDSSGPSPNPSSSPAPSPVPTHAFGKLLTSCMSCHNPGAETLGPVLVGQDKTYLSTQLQHIRSGERVIPFMNDLLKPVDDLTLNNLADYFSGLNPCEFQQAAPDPLSGIVEKGKKISAATCVNCHDTGVMNAPKLWGQKTKYIMKQLGDFKSGNRPSVVMSVQASSLSDQDMADVAAYYNSFATCGASASAR